MEKLLVVLLFWICNILNSFSSEMQITSSDFQPAEAEDQIKTDNSFQVEEPYQSTEYDKGGSNHNSNDYEDNDSQIFYGPSTGEPITGIASVTEGNMFLALGIIFYALYRIARKKN